LAGLRQRRLRGVQLVVSDDHAGLKKAFPEVLPDATWQRCREEARQDLNAWLTKSGSRYPKLCAWVEDNIEETLAFYGLPLPDLKHLKSTNPLERLKELKRRTLVVRLFSNTATCLRLTRALAVEMHEGWIEATRHLNTDPLREQTKERRNAGAAA
jgi:putative transposase